jgi:hypothetical protein
VQEHNLTLSWSNDSSQPCVCDLVLEQKCRAFRQTLRSTSVCRSNVWLPPWNDQDLGELRTLTSRILTTAERAGIDSMVDVSEQLLESLDHDKDMIGIMQAANELLDLCRLTQFSLIQGETQRLVTA